MTLLNAFSINGDISYYTFTKKAPAKGVYFNFLIPFLGYHLGCHLPDLKMLQKSKIDEKDMT